MSHKLSAVFVLVALAVMLPSLRAESFKQVQATNTERVNFAPGGMIRLNNLDGEMSVEGWDRPEVEVTVIKSMPFDYKPKHPDLAKQHLERVRIATERRSDTELAITTQKTKGGARIIYQIHVPRDSRLAIHHGTGSVSVTGVTGDIEATVGRGDIMLWLPPGSYSIDAKTKLGPVISELEGAALSQYLVGQHFTRVNPSPLHRLYLRMGFGGITIEQILPESEAPAAEVTR
jgi:hypothetical protein